MTSLLARVGALEARLASQIIWNSGKRKRSDWICTDCRRRGALKQRRAYSDDALRVPARIFSPWGLDKDDRESQDTIARAQERQTGNAQRPWGLEIETAEETQHDEADQQDRAMNRMWEQFEQTEEAKDGVNDGEEVLSHATDGQYEPFHVDYAADLGPALLQGSSDMVARCLLAAARKDDTAFIQSIPEMSFSECIRILQPSNFTTELATAHLEISEALTKAFGITPIDSTVLEHVRLLREIKTIRNAAGIRCSLADYRMLLRAARDLGSRPMAENMWMSLLHDGITPDTSCYNYYMGAIVFDQVHSPATRHRVRVIPFYKLARRRPTLGQGFTAYRIGEHGLKAKVMHFFSDMLKRGVIANEQSFRTVITALAREGDIATVKSILRRMWNIDVDGLQSGKEEKRQKPTVMDGSNPLRPTAKLLFAVAHAFSINNDIPTALRLVDFISRHYDLQIPTDVWNQLFEWTFVLSSPRTGTKAQTDGTKDGQLPKQSLLNLWNTMTNAPYFVKPTMGMYNHLIRNLQHRDAVPLMYEKICEGIEVHHLERTKAHQALHTLRREIQVLEQSPWSTPRIPLESLRRDYERLELIRRRNHWFVRRWLRLLQSTMRSRVLLNRDEDWPVRKMPRILWEFFHFTGNNVRYEVPGGLVEFKIRDGEEVKEDRAVQKRQAEARRQTLDKVPLLLGEEWVFPKSKPENSQWAWQQP